MQTFLLSAVCGQTDPRKRSTAKPTYEGGSTRTDDRERQLKDILSNSAEDAAECAAADLAHEFGPRT